MQPKLSGYVSRETDERWTWVIYATAGTSHGHVFAMIEPPPGRTYATRSYAAQTMCLAAERFGLELTDFNLAE